MADYDNLKARVKELSERIWDIPAIQARHDQLLAVGIPRKTLHRDELLTNKHEILERVQLRAEEYNHFARNCARSTALAVMEEFGWGNMDIIKALSPFPGFGGTGWMCGGVTGGLMALGLYWGSEDMLDYERMGATILAARKFMPRFEAEIGSVVCPEIQEKVIFGRYMDAAGGPEKMEAFARAKGFEKCSLLPGIGARLASEIIIESLG